MFGIWDYFIVAFLQVIQNILKILEIKYSYDDEIIPTLIVGFFGITSWLCSTALGISAVLENDWVMAAVYVLSGLLGKYLAIKLKKHFNFFLLRKKRKNSKS
jgi:hypothetical protein